MSRKLYITDDMGLDEALGEIEAENPSAAMLWPWLIPYFDDWGRADASARRIKGKIFPLFTSITLELIETALSLFAQHGLITIYQHDGKEYMAVPADKWFRYQSHIHASKRTEDRSRYPAPPVAASQKPAEFREECTEESLSSRDSAQFRETPRDSAGNRASPSPSPSLHTSPTPPHAEGAESTEGEREADPDTAPPSREDSGTSKKAPRPNRADVDERLRALMVGFRRGRYPGRDAAFHDSIPPGEFKQARSVLASIAESGANAEDVEQATTTAMRRFKETGMVTLPAIARHWTALMEPQTVTESPPGGNHSAPQFRREAQIVPASYNNQL